MQLLHISLISLFIGFSLFNLSESQSIVKANEISNYLTIDSNKKEKDLFGEINFWEAKLEKAAHQYPYKLKMASLENQLFKVDGNVSHLNKATSLLEEAAFQTNNMNSTILRSLCRNYISQHRFRDAYSVVSLAEYTGEQLIESQKMLFDVHMELGNYDMAGCYLAEISKVADFDYFIRMAKWQDYLGELDHAIHFMELAMDQAERMNNQDLKLWSYTNLGDFYGHAGIIKEAYKMYTKTLKIEPENIYALKQIAWIAYSYEKNPGKAIEILESIERKYDGPDILLLKSDVEEFQGNTALAKGLRAEFINNVVAEEYGSMYNTCLIKIMIENKDFEKAITLAINEVNQRPTPETNALLAWSYYSAGNIDQAYNILKEKVVGQTSEPIPMYFAAEVYKQKGETDFVEKVKKGLGESSFELGPLMEQKIMKL